MATKQALAGLDRPLGDTAQELKAKNKKNKKNNMRDYVRKHGQADLFK